MMEEKRENLKRALEGLKNQKAPDIWDKIESRLADEHEEGKTNLTKAIQGLEEYQAPDIWDEIAEGISEGTIHHQSGYKRILWSAAASIALLITAFWVFDKPSLGNETLTSSVYSTEEIDMFEVTSLEEDFGTTEDGVLNYVNNNCKLLLTKCENPEFKGLYDTYLELGQAKKELKGKLDETPNKEQLYKYLIRLEKDQAEVGKDLLKMLRYS